MILTSKKMGTKSSFAGGWGVNKKRNRTMILTSKKMGTKSSFAGVGGAKKWQES